MSTLNLENIKHPDSASNNISVDSSGNTIANGNLGIGTSSPTSLLHVQNTSGANIGIQATSGGHWRIGDGVGSTNGNLVIYDYGNSAKRMEIDSAGRVTMPYQPSFSATTVSSLMPSNGTVPGSSLTGVVNTGNHFNTSTGVFTAPVSGVYSIKFCQGTNNVTSQNTFQLLYNGSAQNTVYAWESGDAGTLVFATEQYLNTNDTVAVSVSSGSWAGNGRYSITLLG